MTTEIEKTFFDTFEIELTKKRVCSNPSDCPDEYSVTCDGCDYWRVIKEDYPKITDCILLELIRLGLNYDFVIHAESKDELKEKLLALLIRNDVEFKHQIQLLFKGV